MAVGDFRPWMRLLVMGGMLTAVSVAARSLSKRILEGRLQEKLSAVSEAEERVAARWRPLQEIVGFPDPWVSSPELLPSEACPLEGWVLDATGRPVEGARVAIPNDRATTDRQGHFHLPRHGPLGGVPLRVNPPAGRAGMGHVVIDETPAGVPGIATTVGALRLPNERPAEPADDRWDSPLARRLLFRSASGGAGPSLADWEPLHGAAPQASGGDWLRALERADDGVRLSPPFRPGAEAPAEAVPTTILEGWLRADDGAALESPTVFLDLFSSGVCARGTILGDPKNPRFHFQRAPDGDHRLLVIAPGRLPVSLDISLPQVSQSPPLLLVLEAGADVDLAVEGTGDLPPGLAVVVSGPDLTRAVLAVPPDGLLRLRGLPPEALRFELLRSCAVVRRAELRAAPLERIGVEVVRTLAPGPGNAKIALHVPKDPPFEEVAARGIAAPDRWVYRRGARLDEPTSVARAGVDGAFEICARRGERVFAARGAPPALAPYAGGPASARVAFEPSVALDVNVVFRGRPLAGAAVVVRLIGPESLGRCERTAVTGADGRVRIDGLPADVPFTAELQGDGHHGSVSGNTTQRNASSARIEALDAP
jgi:hypothetical protein